MNVDQWLSGEEGTRVVEAAACAIYETKYGHHPDSGHWIALLNNCRDEAAAALRAALSLTTTCATCGNNPVAAWCEFDGTGEGCERVTEFTGGHASGVVRWKTTTYDGGWIGDEEFGPGDTILRREDGSYSVGSYKAWAQRLTKIVGCPDCKGGTVPGEPALLSALVEFVGECISAPEERWDLGKFRRGSGMWARLGDKLYRLRPLEKEDET